eukprot:1113823-Alexandrium_andersonii.AAC.1
MEAERQAEATPPTTSLNMSVRPDAVSGDGEQPCGHVSGEPRNFAELRTSSASTSPLQNMRARPDAISHDGEQPCTHVTGASLLEEGEAARRTKNAAKKMKKAARKTAKKEDIEALEDLPDAEKLSDPLMAAAVHGILAGRTRYGVVQDIARGGTTKKRLYLVEYPDGELEHLTEDQVRRRQAT